MQPTYYIASGLEWKVCEVISNATFAEAPHKSFFVTDIHADYASNPDYLARRRTESRLETLRAAKYGELPSRKDALFLNTNMDDARRWLHRGARSGYSIYELNPKRTKKAFIANYVWYNYIVRLHKDPIGENRSLFSNDVDKEIVHCLDAYWKNKPTEEFQCATEAEVLFVGELNVTQKVA